MIDKLSPWGMINDSTIQMEWQMAVVASQIAVLCVPILAVSIGSHVK